MTTATETTTARAISALFHHDGQRFHTDDGVSLDEICAASRATKSFPRDREGLQRYGTDTYKWSFRDGSAIVVSGGGWDFPLSTEAECFCWEGGAQGEHNEGCPAGPKTTSANRFAVIAATDYYGPRTEYRLVSLHDTRGEANEVAAAYDPDYDASVRAHRLAHNQSARTHGLVGEVVSEGVEIYDDWQGATAEVLKEAERMWDETVAACGSEEEAEVEDTYRIMEDALRLTGYIALRENGDTASGNRAADLFVIRLES